MLAKCFKTFSKLFGNSWVIVHIDVIFNFVLKMRIGKVGWNTKKGLLSVTSGSCIIK